MFIKFWKYRQGKLLFVRNPCKNGFGQTISKCVIWHKSLIPTKYEFALPGAIFKVKSFAKSSSRKGSFSVIWKAGTKLLIWLIWAFLKQSLLVTWWQHFETGFYVIIFQKLLWSGVFEQIICQTIFFFFFFFLGISPIYFHFSHYKHLIRAILKVSPDLPCTFIFLPTFIMCTTISFFSHPDSLEPVQNKVQTRICFLLENWCPPPPPPPIGVLYRKSGFGTAKGYKLRK